jgi:TonB family protein
MNCGAMLMSGEKVCPVCRQPVAPAPGAGGWQQQPGAPPVAPWPQPTAPHYGPPPGSGSSNGLRALWVGLIGFLLLVVLAGAGFFIYMQKRDALVKGRNDNRDERARVETAPDVPDTDAPSPTNPRSGNSSRPPISGGILNDKATSLPKPTYPAVARAARASGTVTVQVTVDETGKVTEARAVAGHPLLQAAAVAAARNARFNPTMLNGKPVQVKGLLTYNFAPE